MDSSTQLKYPSEVDVPAPNIAYVEDYLSRNDPVMKKSTSQLYKFENKRLRKRLSVWTFTLQPKVLDPSNADVEAVTHFDVADL